MSVQTAEANVQLLRRAGLRATAQRLLVLSALEQHGHATAEQLLTAARAALPGLPPSTVYRTLEALTAHGVVSHTHLTEPTPVYQLAAHADHAHLVCRSCGRVIELDQQVAGDFSDAAARAHGFDVDLGHLSVFGRCNDCVTGNRYERR